eukprot:TRINITY_DN3752_c0_g1_i1.p1 TRINITY_DN3752_c0_g1~~TRINITY_DN3752_c0_g1_i1.p1  ORF type:complete len:370 (-),score=115.30 TRINITY_DN3752_c0_g1_i1:204-1286(-)
MQEGENITVIGGGVIGLTTAICILERFPKVNLTLLAQFLPGDRDILYTSPWAGANWCSFAPADDKRLQELDRVTYKKFEEMWKDEKVRKESGLFRVKEDDHYDEIPMTPSFIRSFVSNYRIMPREDTLKDSKYAEYFETFTLNVPIYLQYLARQVRERGGKIVRHKLNHLNESFVDLQVGGENIPKPSRVFVCVGLGASTLKGVEDSKVYPTFGQVLLVKSSVPLDRSFSQDKGAEDLIYCIPRNDGTAILGGCMEPRNASSVPRPEMSERIAQRCIELEPRLAVREGKTSLERLDVLEINVGHRPSREGGVRIETEERVEGGGKVLVTFEYGHGGAGYQSSWGSAIMAIESSLNSRSKL